MIMPDSVCKKSERWSEKGHFYRAELKGGVRKEANK